MSNHESLLENLEREGWTRQFTANEPRLSEAVALYKETGYEVHLVPVVAGAGASKFPIIGSPCTTCFEGVEDQYKIIFTRKKALGQPPADDLFD